MPDPRRQALLKEVYEDLRGSPDWNKTLLIITYDEHGGFCEHTFFFFFFLLLRLEVYYSHAFGWWYHKSDPSPPASSSHGGFCELSVFFFFF